jgi:CO/xanthine dehydrogenase FAD-binding subunit
VGVYLSPRSVGEAASLLRFGGLTVVAGGTDFYPARVGRPLVEDVLDISAIGGLRGITDEGDAWRIGATTTWTDVIAADLPPLFDGLKRAGREVGGPQIQNAATVCGNLCNASPAADGVPALLSLDARVELAAHSGITTLALSEFILGNRRTARGADQLVTAVVIPRPTGRAAGHFLKLGSRKYLVISIVSAAAVIEAGSDGKVAAARVALGACSPVPKRLPRLEAALLGQPISRPLGNIARPEHLASLTPITDVRADAQYRRDAALALVCRVLNELRL